VQIESRLNEPLEVSLFDPLGRLVYHGQQLGAIDLSSLSGGLYQLVLRRAEDRVVVYSEGLVVE
ncbi:MAG: T9SS type A sorting domain-containing protein, partial [Saprospiraceae bacterium]|nr:T9SS type A sorting domain-containing protein [Saprospiraceae bacterium]